MKIHSINKNRLPDRNAIPVLNGKDTLLEILEYRNAIPKVK